jgi:hypothetical protein
MNNIQKLKILIVSLMMFVFSQAASAVCPVCTVAVGAGVVGLREFGVSDVITGIWFGALIVSSILWMINWLERKKIRFIFRKIGISILFYILFVVPLYFWKVKGIQIVGAAGNTVLGIDKIVFGIIIGAILFILATMAHEFLKNKNEGRTLFPFQKVAVPVVILIVGSIITHVILLIFNIV